MIGDIVLTEHRSVFVDFVKGVCIVLMVACHGGFPYPNFIYVFHMPLFFMMSGWCYVPEKYSFDKYVIRKIRLLYFPYVIINLLVWIVRLICFGDDYPTIECITAMRNVVFFNCFGATGNGGTILTIPTWFLITLFWASICYDLINRALNKGGGGGERIIHMISFACLLLGWGEKIIHNNSDANIFVAIFLIDLGTICKYASNKLKNKRLNTNKFVLLIIFLITLYFIWLLSSNRLELSVNEIVNPIFLIAGSVTGFLLFLSLYLILKGIGMSFKITNVLSRYSIYILTVHLFAFRIVAYLQWKMYGFEYELIKNTFYPINIPGWWIIYLAVGIGVSLIIGVITERLIYFMFKAR